MDITKYGVRELSGLYKEKKLSPVEVTKAYLERIALKDGEINSYISLMEDSALAAAKSAEEKITAGEAGPLTGIPMSIKDNICIKGHPTTCASKMLENFVPSYSAFVIERLEAAGTAFLGKTNMDEFAMGGSSQTSYFGGVKNPYDKTLVSGGSSGGAAASVAAGFCAAALGSDTGGSIRQPSAFCGVTGLKPTYGTVSRYGAVAFASSFDQIGPIAKSAADCGLILEVIAGADVNDGSLKKVPDYNYTGKLGMSMKGMTIGIPKEFFGDFVDPIVKETVMKAAKEYEAMGCTLKEVSLPSLKYAVAAFYLISSAEAASNLSRYDGIKFGYRSENGNSYEELIKHTRREGFGDEVKRRIVLGNYALSSGYYDAYYNKSVQIRGKIKEEYNDIFKECDFIITPTAPTPAYMIGRQDKDPVRMYSADICTVTVNIAGLPAISTTCGYTPEGLPVGMSLVGKSFDEALLIAAADNFEKDFIRTEAAV